MNEIVHTMKKTRGTSGLLGIKLNMHKAYDRINWGLLHEIPINFGFSAWVLGLLGQCYSVDHADILLNGSICGRVKMECRIRQGDPISPYLFIMFAELLSRLLYKLEAEGKIHGIKLGRNGPMITHLFFTADILIFCRANKKEALAVTKCVQPYCDWTGQLVKFFQI